MFNNEPFPSALATALAKRLWVVLLCIALIDTVPLSLPAQGRRSTTKRSVQVASGFEDTIARADSAVKAGDFGLALSAAQAAIKARSTDDRGYYYASYALLKRSLFAEAQKFAELGKLRAPDTRRLDFERLLKAISGASEAAGLGKVGARAIADGSFQEAADSYSKAYELMPSNEELGIKAANIYSSNLEQPSKAIEILKSVQLRTNNKMTYQTVSDLLTKAQAEMSQLELEAKQKADRERIEKGRSEINRQITSLRAARSSLKEAIADAKANSERELGLAQVDDSIAEQYETLTNDSSSMASVIVGGASAYKAQRKRDSASSHRDRAQSHADSMNDLQEKVADIDSRIKSLQNDRP